MKPNKWDDIQAILQQPTPLDEIKWKCQSINRNTGKATMVAYTDARLVRRILDEALGIFGWECTYTRDEKGVLFCALTITSPDGTKVTKEDCGVPSEFEKEKGEVSDAFKRACFTFGICADLYDLDIHYVDCEQRSDGNWKAPYNWSPTQDHKSKQKAVRKEMVNGDYHEVVDQDPPDPEQPEPVVVKEKNGNGEYEDWKLNGRRQPIGFTQENRDKAWKDIEPSLLIWIITKMDTEKYPKNAERQLMGAKEIITRVTAKQWTQPAGDMDQSHTEELAMQIIQSS